METFEFVLIVLTCVAASSVIDKFVNVSIPVIQVVIGLLVALVLPSVQEVHLESELFMLLFIAPLLFNETRETNIRALLLNLNSILSLAIALVVISVLSVGYALHLMVPSIPLAAAFALASALGPTDAATVTALKSNIHLTHRQQTLLSGESLINDASGVVAFQFSVAAAVTGAFSLVDAAGSFTVLFVGGVAMGIVTGFAFSAINAMLGRLGYEDTVANVLYEVLTPFLVYLLAETFHVSGVLAVVAAGLVIALPRRQSNKALFARQKLVSDSTWKVISFLINGTIFVFLGMQLPLAVLPGTNGGLNILQILGIVVVITLFMHGVRFAWLYALETHKLHKGGHLCTGKDAVDGENDLAGSSTYAGSSSNGEKPDQPLAELGSVQTSEQIAEQPKPTCAIKPISITSAELIKNVLVTTIAGAKGAVTLSIILTLPLTTQSGAAFPQRDLLITIAAGVILATLLLADNLLPVLSKSPEADSDLPERLHKGEIAVLEATLGELRSMLQSENAKAKYLPALRLTITRYTNRLFASRITVPGSGELVKKLVLHETEVQQKCLEELRERHIKTQNPIPWDQIVDDITSIRRSVGYYGPIANIAATTNHRSRIAVALHELKLAAQRILDGEIRHLEDADQSYYQACLYALEMEYAELDDLERIANGDDEELAVIASNLMIDHESAIESIWGRININDEHDSSTTQVSYLLPYNLSSHKMSPHFRQQIADARKYADDVAENALRIELDQISRLQFEGVIDREVAARLRENVYYLQMTLSE
ncbi:transporter, CPA2 family [Atopobium sp. ICM42b]|uniref:cation:proton antiporter n=1 Tax=Atopobium sp. ICM42b TaxID=1190620 RepID=UPI0004455E35|nr:sodium:proton antiporter [Atopobium sp. ICM42b]EWC94339.1 transporter, CPA2 family [Atopobium sp. ICM42b]